MKKHFFLIIFIALANLSFAQTFFVDGIIEDYPGQQIYLSGFYGDQKDIIDSTITDQNGHFEFELPKTLASGQYRIMLNGREFFDLILNKQSLKLITARENPIEDMAVMESEENKLYYDYLKLRNKTYYKLELLRPLTKFYPPSEDFYEKIILEFDETQSKLHDFIDSLKNHQAEKFTTGIALLERRPAVNPFWNTFEEKVYMKANYFDENDFSDTALLRSDAISGKIIGYLSLYQNQNLSKEQLESSFIQAVDTILKYSKKEALIYEFTLDYLISGFEKYGFDRVIEHIAENAILEESCEIEDRNSELHKRIETLKLLGTGKSAPDFETRDIYGKGVSLSDIDRDYKLLVFWASWCPHCTNMLPAVRDYYNKNSADLEVIAISIDSAKSDYMEFISAGDYNWINIADFTGWDNEIAALYGIYATPTLLLLDRDNRILGRPNSVREIKKILGK